MPENIYMPKLGMTMTEGKVLQWMGTEGGKVEWECPVVSIETDKVTYEVDAPASGFLHIMVPEGEKCSVGEILGMVAESREEYEEIVIQKDKSPTTIPSERAICSSVEKALTAKRSKEIRLKISPRARKLAQVRGIDLEDLQGTGPGGRIVQEDILRALEMKKGSFVRPVSDIKITQIAQAMAEDKGVDITQTRGTGPDGRIEKKDVLQAISQITKTEAPAETLFGKIIPMSSIRKVIARRMSQSAFTAPHISLFSDVEMDALIRLREQILSDFEAQFGVRISINDFIVKAVGLTIQEYPLLNAAVDGDAIRINPDINVGLAVAMEEGLIVPAIPRVDCCGLGEVARMRADLVARARAGKLTVEEIERGTFTVSSLAQFDITFFTAILNPPQSGILTVGKPDQKLTLVDGGVKAKRVTRFGLAVDHRIIDGAIAAQFLQSLKKKLENPSYAFLQL